MKLESCCCICTQRCHLRRSLQVQETTLNEVNELMLLLQHAVAEAKEETAVAAQWLLLLNCCALKLLKLLQ
jgi:hypothetical protein